jgi:transposase-like protein
MDKRELVICGAPLVSTARPSMSKRRSSKAARRFFCKLLEWLRYARRGVMVTDKLNESS